MNKKTLQRDLDFKQIIDNRYFWKRRVIQIKFYSILIWIILLIIFTVILYFIAYKDIKSLLGINLRTNFFNQIRYYVYWIIFFNNIILSMSFVYLYYLFIDNIDILTLRWERKLPFNDDETFNN